MRSVSLFQNLNDFSNGIRRFAGSVVVPVSIAVCKDFILTWTLLGQRFLVVVEGESDFAAVGLNDAAHIFRPWIIRRRFSHRRLASIRLQVVSRRILDNFQV